MDRRKEMQHFEAQTSCVSRAKEPPEIRQGTPPETASSTLSGHNASNMRARSAACNSNWPGTCFKNGDSALGVRG